MKVLLAMDESSMAAAAQRFILDNFHPEETDVHILNVVEPVTVAVPAQMSPGYFPELAGQVKHAREFVARVASVIADHRFRVTTTVAQGFARSAIVEEAEHWNADLIVMGSHGRKGLDRFLLGSVSESVLREASCSVLIVKTPE